MRVLAKNTRYQSKLLWNLQSDDNDDYSVSRLRSIYSDLLKVVEPCHRQTLMSSISSSISNKENSRNIKTYTVRNFRRSRDESSYHHSKDRSSTSTRMTRTDRDGGVDKEEIEDEVICFEPFATDHISADNSTWKTLCALKRSESVCTSNQNPNDGGESGKSPGNPAKSVKAIQALYKTRRLEARVIELIRSLGETVVYGEQRNGNSIGRYGKGSVSDRAKQMSKGKSQKKGSASGNEAVFEYFCDKNMLSLLVDICKAKPLLGEQGQDPIEIHYNGVTWTALVKAQVLQTISILISNVSEPTSLFYLLSNNYINEVVASIVPLHQWTRQALDEILPVYISFLRTLALKLTDSTHLFQFFCDQNGSSSTLPTFPLFYAACEVVSSPLDVAKCDTFVHTTALNLILNIFQLQGEEIHSVLGNECYTEQTLLLSHLCKELRERYNDIVEWMMTGTLISELSSRGLKVDEEDQRQRREKLNNEVAKLEDTFQFINDLLWCSQRTVNVRLCEYLIRFIIFDLVLVNLKNAKADSSDDDSDSGGERKHARTVGETKCEASTFFLYKLFTIIDYVPLLRMIMVALLHPYTPAESQIDEMAQKNKEYVLTPALNAIAQNEFMVVDEDNAYDNSANNDFNSSSNNNFSSALMEDLTTHVIHHNSDEEGTDDESEISVAAIANAFRHEVMTSLSGEYGDRQCTFTAMMLEQALKTKVVDSVMLQRLGLVPLYHNHDGENDDGSNASSSLDPSSTLEDVMSTFFESLRKKSFPSIGPHTMDCYISLSLLYLPHLLQAMAGEGVYFESIHTRMQNSAFLNSITSAKEFFAQDCQRLKCLDGVSELFPDFFEEAIGRIFKGTSFSPKDGQGAGTEYKCDLSQLSKSTKNEIIQLLMQRDQSAKTSEISDAQFAVRYMLILRGLDGIIQDQIVINTSGPASLGVPSPRWSDHLVNVKTVYQADDDILFLGRLSQQSIVGSNEIVQGEDRKFFNFSPSLALTDGRATSMPNLSSTARHWAAVSDKEKRRQLADKILEKATRMVLVVDLNELLVLKPKAKNDQHMGTILCCTMMTNIIAVAMDGEWLHIAMRNVEDIGALIKKGNMALRFSDASTCQAAKEYIEETRSGARRELSSKIDDLLRSQCI